MKKNELKTGMVVEVENGNKYMVIKDNLINCDGYMRLNSYNDDLTDTDDVLGFSIIKVYEADEIYQLRENNWDMMSCIWDREKEVDWSKVPVDTKILVNLAGNWLPRYFAKYENGRVYAWQGGGTSWSSSKAEITFWEYAKLYACEDESEEKKTC